MLNTSIANTFNYTNTSITNNVNTSDLNIQNLVKNLSKFKVNIVPSFKQTNNQ
jgi:hypothetical protein